MEGLSVDINEALIQCALCGNRDRSLKLLWCNHSVCEGCLATQEEYIQCPVCLQQTDLQQGIDQLPDNFLTQHIKVVQALMDDPLPCKLCDKLGKKTVSSHLCYECYGDPLCDGCVKVHLGMTATKWHQPSSLAEIFNARDWGMIRKIQERDVCCCCTHGGMGGGGGGGDANNILKFQCQTCEVMICQACAGKEHAGHKHVQLSSMGNDLRHDMNGYLRQVQSHVQRLAAGIAEGESQIGQMQVEADDLINKVKQRTDELIQMVKQIGEFHIVEIQCEYARQADKQKANVNSLKHLKTYAEHTRSFADLYNKIAPDQEAIRHYDLLCMRVRELKATIEDINANPLECGPVSIQYPPPSTTVEHMRSAFGSLENTASTQAGSLELSIEKMHNSKRGQMCVSYMPGLGTVAMEEPVSVQITDIAEVVTESFGIIRGLAINDDGEICVVGKTRSDYTPCISIFSLSGKQRSPITYKVRNPYDLKTLGSDFYVADCDGRCVLKLNRRGTILKEIKLPKKEESVPHVLGLAVTDEGHLYVSSYHTHTIYFCSKDDSEFREHIRLKDHALLASPNCLCLTPGGDLVVSQSDGESVRSFSVDKIDKFICQCLQSPVGICCDQLGHVFVAEMDSHQVTALSPKGEIISHVVSRNLHGIERPRFVAMSKDGDRLVVAHSNNKVTVFSLNSEASRLSTIENFYVEMRRRKCSEESDIE